MPTPPRKVDVSKAIPTEGLQVKAIELKPPEDEQEKALRLHKEKVGFYIKELGTLLFAAIVVGVALACSLDFLLSPQSSATEKEWGRSLFMAIVTGAIGYAFGKATK